MPDHDNVKRPVSKGLLLYLFTFYRWIGLFNILLSTLSNARQVYLSMCKLKCFVELVSEKVHMSADSVNSNITNKMVVHRRLV